MKKRKNNKNPKISVVMPVYNAGSFVRDSVESILNQTYKNFEFIIVDDCSTDGTYEILQKYARRYKKKIKLMRNSRNLGVSETVKKAIEAARGEYLARMDADDIAISTRLEKQLEYLEKNEETVAVGGQCFLIDKNAKVIGKKTFPTEFEQIYKYIFHFVPIQQPTIMIAKKRLPSDFVYYVDGMNTAEEVELYFKLFNYGKVENLNEFVHMYRIHDTNTSLLNVRKTFLLTLISRIKAVAEYGYKPTLKGIAMTFMQSILILLLPQSFTLYIYKYVRKMLVSGSPSIFPLSRPQIRRSWHAYSR